MSTKCSYTPFRSKIYYLSPRKAHLFGIQDEAVREQINYVLDEGKIIGKGPNGTLSMVFDGIKRLNKGEKQLQLTFSPCSPAHAPRYVSLSSLIMSSNSPDSSMNLAT